MNKPIMNAIVSVTNLLRKILRDPTANWQPGQKVALHITLIAALVLVSTCGASNFPSELRILVGRVILIGIFTILPASLYPLFLITRGKTLWEEFRVNLALLDPVGNEELSSIYEKKFSALYGPVAKNGFTSALLRGETSFPILFATFTICIGWSLFFSNVNPDLTTGAPPTLVADAVFGGLVSPFTFGFLGAYLYSLNMLFRRYVQSDLKSVAYTHISQRILLTWVWAFVLNVVPWDKLGVTSGSPIAFVSVLAFVVGIFPDIAWQVLTQFIRSALAITLPSFREKYPLAEIDGLTIWDEARLMEEAVENIENLVTTGIVDLMFRTNLKPERIVHWIDQGVLRLHLDGDEQAEQAELKQALRRRGIRTATDLISVYEAATAAGAGGAPRGFSSKNLDSLVRDLVIVVKDDPNMYHVQAWRAMNATRMAKTCVGDTCDIFKDVRNITAARQNSRLLSSNGHRLHRAGRADTRQPQPQP